MSTGQQHGLPQFAQSQPGMYQIVQQAPGQAGHVQLQGKENKFKKKYDHEINFIFFKN